VMRARPGGSRALRPHGDGMRGLRGVEHVCLRVFPLTAAGCKEIARGQGNGGLGNMQAQWAPALRASPMCGYVVRHDCSRWANC